MVTQVDHIELVVHHFDEYVALFRALGFQELARTKHHGDSVEFQLPGPNQPIFEIHRPRLRPVHRPHQPQPPRPRRLAPAARRRQTRHPGSHRNALTKCRPRVMRDELEVAGLRRPSLRRQDHGGEVEQERQEQRSAVWPGGGGNRRWTPIGQEEGEGDLTPDRRTEAWSGSPISPFTGSSDSLRAFHVGGRLATALAGQVFQRHLE